MNEYFYATSRHSFLFRINHNYVHLCKLHTQQSWALNVPDTRRQVILIRRNNTEWTMSFGDQYLILMGRVWHMGEYQQYIFLLSRRGRWKKGNLWKEGKRGCCEHANSAVYSILQGTWGMWFKILHGPKMVFCKVCERRGKYGSCKHESCGPKVSSDQIHACEHQVIEKS